MDAGDISSATQAAGGFLNSAAPIIGAGITALADVGSGLFSANQARKNRKFQERMYKMQVEDNRKNWEMMNEYNLPSAQLARLRDAGLNPLLMYGQGGVSQTASSPATGGSAGSGAMASMGNHTNFGQAFAQAAMMQAQIRNMEADTLVKQNEAKNLSNQDEFYQLTKDLDIAKKHGDIKYLDESIHNLAIQSDSLEKMTKSQLLTLQQARDFQIKYYDLDADRVENQIWYNIEQIALGREQVNATLKQIAVNLYNAKTERFRAATDRYRAETERTAVNNQAEVFVAEIAKIQAETALSDQEKLNKMVDFLRDYGKLNLYNYTGTDDTGVLGSLLLCTGVLFGRDDSVPFYQNPPKQRTPKKPKPVPKYGNDYHDYYNSGD